jgi:hypothetical protein
MNDVEKARFNAALDLSQWLDTRIAQQVEHQLGQRLAQEREYWRTHVVDLIAAEREQLVALLEKKHEKVIGGAQSGSQGDIRLGPTGS